MEWFLLLCGHSMPVTQGLPDLCCRGQHRSVMQQRNSSRFPVPSSKACRSLASGAGALLFSAGLLMPIPSAAQGTAWQPPADASPYVVPRTEQRQMQSERGDTYQIMISWPDGEAPPEGFPVIYLLDGNAAF